MKRILLLLFVMLNTFIGHTSNEKFYNINEMFGISMREVNSICKDNDGFIWASSKTGILRLTDDDYKIYNLPYESANILTVKLEYKYPTLYAYTNNGQIFKYNTIYDRFELVIDLKDALKSRFLSINTVRSEENDKSLISTSTGLYLLNNKQLTLIGNNTSENNALELMNKHNAFVAIRRTIYIANYKADSLRKIVDISKFSNSTISKLYYNSTKKRLWIGTLSDGIFYYDIEEDHLAKLKIKSFPKQPVLAIETNSDSTLLIGIDGQGIWEISQNGDKVFNTLKENANNPSSLRGNGVYDIFCDNNEKIWVSTYSGGISYYENKQSHIEQITHQTNNTNSLINNDINDVIEDKDGKIWLATNNGISCWDRQFNNWKTYYENKKEQAQVFLSLCEDKKGRIWAGTYSSGVYLLEGKTGKELEHYSSHVKNSQLNTDFVSDIFEDSYGDIWIGGVNTAVTCYSLKENTFKKYSQQPLIVISEFEKNQILLGCTYGLLNTDKQNNQITYLLSHLLIHDILVKDNNIWLCTSGDGLVRFNSTNYETEFFTTETGLPSNFINSILYTDSIFWLGTENGLCKFNPEDKSIETFPSIQALSASSFNRNSKYRLKNGNLAWGTNNGLIIFNQNELKETIPQGKIFFQDLSISGRSIREIPSLELKKPLNQLEEIKLKYNQNTLTLELLPIGLSPGSKFSWKMKGLDEAWSQPSNNRIITYSNIQSKNFELKIKLYGNSLSQLIDERTLAIEITPPFWGTWWFLIISIVLISGIIYSLLWYYINLLKQKHTEEKVKFFTNTAHDIRTSLTLIKGPIEELSKESEQSQSGKYYLNLVKEQANRLSSVVTQLMDFQKVDIGMEQLSFKMIDIVKLIENRSLMFESLAKSRNIKLIFKSDQKAFTSGIDETVIEKIVDNLISNAIKYSYPKTEVLIALKYHETTWTLEVKDHGIGISKKAQKQLFKEFYRGENAINTKIVGSGIGLLLVKNYVTLHGGNVSCTSEENKGSCFQVSIPIKTVPIESENIKISSENRTLLNNSGNTQIELSTPDNSTGKMRILIVEDNDELRNFIHYALNKNFDVLKAEDGVEAWEIIEKETPDLIVSDIMMPNMDGFKLCRQLKSNYETSHIPIILLTALTGKAEQIHGLGLGADDYITKPFDISLLQQKIKSIISNREAIREKALKLIKINPSERLLKNDLNDQFVKKLLEVVNENIANTDFNKNVFAKAMNVSSSLLYKKVKALTNQSPTDFIKTVRLNHSLELLQSNKYNITEVSELCGYTSVGYFSTVFKKSFGKSPTEVFEK